MNTASDTSHSTWENTRKPSNERDYFAWAKTPGINPMKVAAVVAGFVIFPPLGLVALGYFIWKGRRGWDHDGPAFAAGPGYGRRHGCGRGHGRWTGNAAFDAHQAEVMQTLRADREAFRTFRQEQRRQRDQQAYDSFRATQAPVTPVTPETPKAE